MSDSRCDAGPLVNCLIVINAGSSSIKFSLFEGSSSETLKAFAHGEIEGIGTAPHFFVKDGSGRVLFKRGWDASMSHESLLAQMMSWIETYLGPARLAAAGHRVAHGGMSRVKPELVTSAVLEELRALIPLAPLHQPHNLAPMDVLAKLHPDLPQVACFDTSFHATNSRLSRMYGLPQTMTDEGILRFGFHGLSYEYIASKLQSVDRKAASGRTIVAHLGSGASMCSLVAGQSIASTMGFSTLDGLVMGTRCGELDPGVLLYLLQQKKMNVKEIETLLYKQSGLLGVSGVSSDVRNLLDSSDAGAQEAIDLFTYRAAREIGSLTAAACGIDALVFTAGIGENSPEIRARICERSAWLGIVLDPDLNYAGGPRISSADSPVSVWVIPTNEELMVARHTFALVFSSSEEKPAIT